MTVIRFRFVTGLAAIAGVAVGLSALAQTTAPAAPQPLPYQSKEQSVGVVNCSSGICHGSVRPYKDSNVLQTEYVTWSRVDKHARAYLVLGNAQSQRIAGNLGIGDPMKAKVCLDCHAHNIPESLRGERFKLEDGVS